MWALLPVKRFAAGKSRLGTRLSLRQRTELTCHLLTDVLQALRAAVCVERIIVLSNEPGIDRVLESARLKRHPENEEGDLNRSLMSLACGLPSRAGQILIVPSDVPCVRAADIEALGAACADGLVLCPAARDGGTNALLSSWPLVIPLHFGVDSFAQHLDSARRLRVSAHVLKLPGLVRDMDRADDLDWLADAPVPGAARAYVRGLARAPVECAAP